MVQARGNDAVAKSSPTRATREHRVGPRQQATGPPNCSLCHFLTAYPGHSSSNCKAAE
jgi:hypothetical protein